MYSLTKGAGVSIGSYSIPPRAPEGMAKEMAKLGNMQWLIQEGGGIDKLASIIAAADDMQIDLARPHLAYAIREIEQRMVNEYVRMSMGEGGDKASQPLGLLDSKSKTAHDIVVQAVDKVIQDGTAALEACRTTPGNLRRLHLAAEIAATLAEAAEVTAAAAVDRPGRELARKTIAAFQNIEMQVRELRLGAGSLYSAGIEQAFGKPGDIRRRGDDRAQADAGPVPVLTDDRINKAADGLPYWLDYYDGKKPGPMRPGQADKIRQATVSLMEDYAGTFQAPGFFQALKAAAVTAQWHAERMNRYALDPQSDADKARKSATEKDYVGRPRGDEAGWLTFHVNSRKCYAKDGALDTARAADLRIWLSTAAARLRPGTEVQRTVEFARDAESGALVGRFSSPQPGDRTFVIYNDSGSGGCKGAVYLAAFEAGHLDGGVPAFDPRSKAEGAELGTNYRGLQDALAQLANKRDQDYFAGFPFIIKDVAAIPEPLRDTREPAMAGPRM